MIGSTKIDPEWDAGDIKRYTTNSLGIGPKGEIVRIRDAGANSKGKLVLIAHHITKDDIKEATFSPEDIDLIVPRLGVRKFGSDLFYISRYAQRQWKRGLNPDNVDVVPVLHTNSFSLTRGTKLVELFSNNDFIAPKEDKVKELQKRKGYSAVFDNNVWAKNIGGTIILGYKFYIVGTIDDLRVPELKEIMQEEIWQYLS